VLRIARRRTLRALVDVRTGVAVAGETLVASASQDVAGLIARGMLIARRATWDGGLRRIGVTARIGRTDQFHAPLMAAHQRHQRAKMNSLGPHEMLDREAPPVTS
jgi:hypothetical protein